MRVSGFTILIILLIAVLLLPIWLIPFPPLTDYPSHLLSIFISAEYNNPVYDFGKYFVVHWRPIPNLGSEVLIYGLAQVVPITVAGRIYLSLFSVLYVLGGVYLVRSFDRRNTVLGIFSVLFVFNWYFNQGYLNFWGSIPLAYFALGYWLRHPHLAGFGRLTLFSVLCLLVYFFHFVSWALLGLIIGIFILSDRTQWSTLWRIIVAFVPSLALFGYYYFGLAAGVSTVGSAIYDHPIGNITSALIRSFTHFTRPGIAVYVVPLLVIAGLFLWGSVVRRQFQTSQQRRAVLAVVVLVLLYFMLPVQMSSVWPVNLRVNQFVFLLALCAVPAKMVQPFRRSLAGIAVLSSLVVIGYVWNGYQSMSDKIETYVSGIDHIEPRSTMLPLTLAVSGGWAVGGPLSTTWAYYHIEEGGAGPYLFDLAHGQIVNYRRPKREMFPAPSLYPNRPLDYNPEQHAQYYDYVLLWDPNEELIERVEQDFGQIFQNRELLLYEKKSRISP